MASKSELESQVVALEKKIKDLESAGLVHTTISTVDNTNSTLLAELSSANENISLLKAAVDDLTKHLEKYKKNLEDVSAERDELKKLCNTQKSASGDVLTAKEISYHYHRRELDDGDLFTRKP